MEMDKRSTPSNDNIAKKLEAIKKANERKRSATVSSKAESKKKLIAKKLGVKPEPIKKEEQEKKIVKKTSVVQKKVVSKKKKDNEIDFSLYPDTDTSKHWQSMVQDSLDKYIASLPSDPTDPQKRYISSTEERIRRAPYDLRNSCKSGSKRECTSPENLLPESNKKK